MSTSTSFSIETTDLCRSFDVRKKAEGLWQSVQSLVYPRYETLHAVSHLHMQISPGEIVGFLGPNGAGKTTTLKMLSGLIAPTSGVVQVLEYGPFKRQSEFLRQISLVMGQKQNLWWDLPPIETFAIHREMYDLSDIDYRERLEELVNMLQIKDCLETQARKLSLGQRMRCELALSLLHRPRILFLDEPTIGLDILMQKRIRQFLLEYHARFKPTILLTSHYMEDVAALTARVIVINRGKKVFDGPLAKLTSEAKPDRFLTVTFQSLPAKFDPEQYGTLIKQENIRFTLKISRDSIAKTASALFATEKVIDLIVEEPPLEEIMSHLFVEQES